MPDLTKETSWVIPEGTKDVYVETYDKDGNYLERYKVSSYLTLTSGMKLRVIAR